MVYQMTKPEEYAIRFGRPLDIPNLIAADRAASELFRPTGLVPDMATIPESIPVPVLTDALNAGMVLVATHEDTAIGFALCQIFGTYLYLHQLSVAPEHGRKGIGRELVQRVFLLAENNKCHSVALSTFREVPWNAPFYASLGFKELPAKKRAAWMLEIEQEQSKTLDITKRCFMRRPVRRPLRSRFL